MEDKCVFCDSFAIFKELMLAGHSMEDAYHASTQDLVNQAFSDAFDEGYVLALTNIKNTAQYAINDVLEDECTCQCDDNCSDCN